MGPGLRRDDKNACRSIRPFVETLRFAIREVKQNMSGLDGLDVIHLIWDGPLNVEKATKANDGSDYGVYQIYGMHEVTGPDTLFYIGQADAQPFAGRIKNHYYHGWGRWDPDQLSVYFGRIADIAPVTNEDWGKLIDKAESVLIWKIGPPFNAARVKTLKYKYEENPILIVNHRRRHRLPECISTCTEFINTDMADFKFFGVANGHPVKPPIPAPGGPAEEA
jgi:hypothetical protein